MWHIPHHSYFTLTTAALPSRDHHAILEVSAESFDKTCARIARQKVQVLAVKRLLVPWRKTTNDDKAESKLEGRGLEKSSQEFLWIFK